MRASIEDFGKVQQAAEKYAKAVGNGKSEVCKPAFLDSAMMYGFLDGNFGSVPKSL